MTSKDYFKLILCLYRYDMNVEIDIANNGFDGQVWDIRATNSVNGDGYSTVSFGFMDAVEDFLRYIEHVKTDWDKMELVEAEDEGDSSNETFEDVPPSLDTFWLKYTMKNVLDDNFRKEQVANHKRAERENRDYQEFFKDVDKQIQDSMPCRNGTCKDRVWTDMACVDHCEKHYRMNCPKLLQWHEDTKVIREKRNKEWDTYKDMIDKLVSIGFKRQADNTYRLYIGVDEPYDYDEYINVGYNDSIIMHFQRGFVREEKIVTFDEFMKMLEASQMKLS